MNNTSNIYVFASPSGGGKSSLAKAIVEQLSNISISISHTTRVPREGEINGQQYHFVSEAEFQTLIKQDAFIEYAKVFNYHYGTGFDSLTQQLNSGNDVILDIDWQGARQLKGKHKNLTTIFILPPSVEILEQRLFDRKQDNQQIIADRMEKACQEMSHYEEFDYLVVNDEFDNTLKQILHIIRAERLKTKFQQVKLQSLLSKLLLSK